jgi:hypothetical protein
MWIRKSEEEIHLVLQARDRRRQNLWKPVATAVALTTIALLLYSVGLRFLSQGIIIVSSGPVEFGIGIIGTGMVLFLILSVFFVYHQRRHGGLFDHSGVLLCRDCKQPRRSNENLRCRCGGSLEELDHFDWVSEAEADDVRDYKMSAAEPGG